MWISSTPAFNLRAQFLTIIRLRLLKVSNQFNSFLEAAHAWQNNTKDPIWLFGHRALTYLKRTAFTLIPVSSANILRWANANGKSTSSNRNPASVIFINYVGNKKKAQMIYLAGLCQKRPLPSVWLGMSGHKLGIFINHNLYHR